MKCNILIVIIEFVHSFDSSLTIILSVTLVFDTEDFGLIDGWLFVDTAEALHEIDDNEDDVEDIDSGDVCIGTSFAVETPCADIVTTVVGDMPVDELPFTALTPLITAASCDETFGTEFPLWWSECFPFTLVAVNGLIVWWTFRNFLSVTFILTNCWFSFLLYVICYMFSRETIN